MARKIPQKTKKKNAFSVLDQILARALVYAVLGFETDDVIALARSVARSEERRATA